MASLLHVIWKLSPLSCVAAVHDIKSAKEE